MLTCGAHADNKKTKNHWKKILTEWKITALNVQSDKRETVN